MRIEPEPMPLPGTPGYEDPDWLKRARELLPAWFFERMWFDEWPFGLLTDTGKTICITTINAISQDGNGDIWLDVELMDEDRAKSIVEGMPNLRGNILSAPTDRTLASVAIRHIVAAFELSSS